MWGKDGTWKTNISEFSLIYFLSGTLHTQKPDNKIMAQDL